MDDVIEILEQHRDEAVAAAKRFERAIAALRPPPKRKPRQVKVPRRKRPATQTLVSVREVMDAADGPLSMREIRQRTELPADRVRPAVKHMVEHGEVQEGGAPRARLYARIKTTA